MSGYFTDESRKNWFSRGAIPSNDDLKLGCLQRERRDELQRTVDRLNHSNAALRGVIKRMKKVKS